MAEETCNRDLLVLLGYTHCHILVRETTPSKSVVKNLQMEM